MDPKISINSLPRLQSTSVFILLLGFLIGILVSSFISISVYFGVLLVSVAAVLLISEKFLNNDIDKNVLLLSLIILSFGLGILRYAIKDYHVAITPDSTGVVISEPEVRENSTRFVLETSNGEKVLINTDLYSQVKYGDRVEVRGKLQEPGVIDDGLGKPFDYAKYLSKDDIYFTMNFAQVTILSQGEGNLLKHILFGLKNSLTNKIKEILTEPGSSLLAGLIVAGKGAMPKDILEEFRRAGVIHIVVLSGYNITIIAEFMRKIFENFLAWTRFGARPRVAAGASILGILFFVLMTGAEATVVRAAIMVLVVIMAKLMGRTYSAPRALLFAATLMVIHNPKILVFDPSFQLSFLATCGLIYFSPIFENLLNRVTFLPEKLGYWGEKLGFKTMLATTLATQTTVLPFLIYSVGDVSLVSLPANILILLFIPVTMFVGFLATLISYISITLAIPLSFVTHLFLSWILGVSHYLGNLSYASIPISFFPFWIVLIIYGVLIILLKYFVDQSSLNEKPLPESQTSFYK